ncbi:MAG: MGMT family protein [Ruminococcaceae bacterium]|nr:MGMT family protein [Oscillospiraceae bacterium]
MSLVYEKIYAAVQKIPRGKVATYSQIAALAGNVRMCRAVGNALHRNPYYGVVPCHRVVNAKGCLAKAFVFGGDNVQAEMLRKEGVEVIDGRVDLEKYGARF